MDGIIFGKNLWADDAEKPANTQLAALAYLDIVATAGVYTGK
jgi:hypothetical protein